MSENPQIGTLKRRLVATVLGAITVVSGIAIAWRMDADNRRADVCASQVQERVNDRAIWLYLIGQRPTDAKAIEFRVALDDILPELTCVRGSSVPVPVTESTPP